MIYTLQVRKSNGGWKTVEINNGADGLEALHAQRDPEHIYRIVDSAGAIIWPRKPKKIVTVTYEHECLRCKRSFQSSMLMPTRCGKCKSPYWDSVAKPRPTKAAMEETPAPSQESEAVPESDQSPQHSSPSQ